MKIISFNVGYFLGYNGTHSQCLKNPGKILKANSQEERENMQRFMDLMEAEAPDIAALQEIDNGSIRTGVDDQVNHINQKIQDYSASYKCKYSGILGSMPMTRNLGNSLFFKNGEVENHRLSGGQKDLVQELKMEDFSLFSVHMATIGQWPRRRQLRSLSKIVNKRDNYMIVGDWNTHQGKKEINYARKTLQCQIQSPGKTFPADNPTHKLDLVAHKNLEVNVERMQNTFSDHRPVKIHVEDLEVS